jgi:hypothetical protein
MNRGESYLISTATDGHLIVHHLADYIFQADKTPQVFKNVHQSGINSLDIRVMNDESLWMASVGDDTRLSLIQLVFEKEKIKQQKKFWVDMAHASSIIGELTWSCV